VQAQNNGAPPAEREGEILRELRGGRAVEKERATFNISTLPHQHSE